MTVAADSDNRSRAQSSRSSSAGHGAIFKPEYAPVRRGRQPGVQLERQHNGPRSASLWQAGPMRPGGGLGRDVGGVRAKHGGSSGRGDRQR